MRSTSSNRGSLHAFVDLKTPPILRKSDYLLNFSTCLDIHISQYVNLRQIVTEKFIGMHMHLFQSLGHLGKSIYELVKTCKGSSSRYPWLKLKVKLMTYGILP